MHWDNKICKRTLMSMFSRQVLFPFIAQKRCIAVDGRMGAKQLLVGEILWQLINFDQ